MAAKRKSASPARQRPGSQPTKAKQAIVVLGMHRSGTSALTRVLSLLGADLPKNVLGPGLGNETGHWESDDLWPIHDDMLTAAGTSWHDWRAIGADWIESGPAEATKQRLLAILSQDFAGSTLFTVKDPRICRFVPLWLDVLARFAATPVPVLPVRSPLEVAASLRRRNGFPLTKSYLLWLRHVLDAERNTRHLPRAIITYDLLLDDWRAVAKRISETTGVRWPRRSDRSELEIDRYISETHRHHVSDEAQLKARADVTDWVKDAYATLRGMSYETERADQHRVLDRISGEFDKAAAAFGLLLAGEAEDAETRLRDAQTRGQTTLVERDTALAKLAEREIVLETANNALQQAQQQVADNAARLRALDDELIVTRGRAHEAEAGAAAREREVERLQHELEAARTLLRDSQTQAQRLGGEVGQATQRLREAETLIAVLTEERDVAQTSLADNVTDLAAVEARAREAEANADASRRNVDLLSRQLETNRQWLQTKEAENQRLREQMAQAEERQRDVEARAALITEDRDKAVAAVRAERDDIRHELVITQSLLRGAQREKELVGAKLENAQRLLQHNNQDRTRLAQDLAKSKAFADTALAEVQELKTAQEDLRRSADDAAKAQQTVTRLQETLRQTQSRMEREIAMRDARAAQLQHDLNNARAKADALRSQHRAEEQKHRDAMLARQSRWSLARLWRRSPTTRQRREMVAIEASGLFDPLWYLKRYPDVAAVGQDALTHYALHGGAEGRDPHPLFDGKWYLEQYPDYAISGLSPLGHYVLKGAAQGCDPNPLFDTDWYLEQYPAVAGSDLNPLQHFWAIGAAQGFDPNPQFDTSWYLETNADVRATGDNPLLHYIIHGEKENRACKPAGKYNDASSRDSVSNIVACPVTETRPIPLVSWAEQVQQSGLFDAEWYLKTYRDVARAESDPFQHFMEFGSLELRNPGPHFDATWYLEEYPEVRSSGLDPFSHYLKIGKSKGLLPTGSRYRRWCQRFDTLSPLDRAAIEADIELSSLSSVDVILFVDTESEGSLDKVIAALKAQIFKSWRAKIIFRDDYSANAVNLASKAIGHDPRLCLVLPTEQRPSVSDQTSEYTIILWGSVVLRDHALYMFMRAASEMTNVWMVYSDEDTLDSDGIRQNPVFKPRFSPTLAAQKNYFGRCVLVRSADAARVEHTMKSGNEYLANGLTEIALEAPRGSIGHIPTVLFHDLSQGQPFVKPLSIDVPDDELSSATIIIPTKDRVDLLKPCIDSIETCSNFPRSKLEIIIVDNGSTDEPTLAFLDHLAKSGKARIIRDPEPYNYSRLNNLAARNASHEVLVLLNNDTVIFDPLWLRRLIRYASLSDVAAVGARLLYPDGTIQHAGCALGIQGIAAHHLVGVAEDDDQAVSDLTREISAVTGACLAIRKSVYNMLGGLDTKVAVAFNDTLLCLDAIQAGYRNIYIRDPILFHHESKSRGYDDTPAKLRVLRNESIYARSLHNVLFREDPYYSPNLSLQKIDELAFPPRASKPWRQRGRSTEGLKILFLVSTEDSAHAHLLVSLLVNTLVKAGHEVLIGGPSDNHEPSYEGGKRVHFRTPEESASYAVDIGIDCIVATDGHFAEVVRWLGRYPPILILETGRSAETSDHTAIQMYCAMATKVVKVSEQLLQMANSAYFSGHRDADLVTFVADTERMISTLPKQFLDNYARTTMSLYCNIEK